MAEYMGWRDGSPSLWCWYSVPGWPHKYRLPVRYLSGATEEDKARLKRKLGIPLLHRIQAAAINEEIRNTLEIQLFDKPIKKEVRTYNPKFWRIVARYWWLELRHADCAKVDRYHLAHCLKKFGPKYGAEIYPSDISAWLKEMKAAGVAINTINNRLSKLKAAYNNACKEQNPLYHFSHNPATDVEKLEGGAVRQKVLTPELFERNYSYLTKEGGAKERYAFLYLLAWETGHRPEEVAEYTWEMVQTEILDGAEVRYFLVPVEISKTDDPWTVVISDRLWQAMHAWGWRTGPIARNSAGEKWIKATWQEHAKALRRKFGDHAYWLRDTRRGFATRKRNAGYSEGDVMDAGGWKTRSAFKRYMIGNLRAGMRVNSGTVQVQRQKEG